MNFLDRIFRRNMVECPRCVGKGHVDIDDIIRLKKELRWMPGKCAYCNGLGKVPAGRIEQINPDFDYLTTDLSSWERLKVINCDPDALKRADEFREAVQKTIDEIEHLYFLDNKEPGEIAEHFFHTYGNSNYSAADKQEFVDYIERVIKSKIEKKL